MSLGIKWSTRQLLGDTFRHFTANQRKFSSGVGVAFAVTLSVPGAIVFAQETPILPDRPSAQELAKPEYLPNQDIDNFSLPKLQPRNALQESNGPMYDVTAYEFTGNMVITATALKELAAPYIGTAVSSSRLEELRDTITRYYVHKGYINSGARLDKNFYRSGVVYVQIVEGHLDELRLAGLNRLQDSYVRDRLPPRDEVLNVNVLKERFQLLLADPLFSKIGASLLPGQSPGHAILDVEVIRRRPFDFSIFFNNHQAPSIGAEAFGFSGRVRNLSGRGDVLDISFQSGGHENNRYGIGWNTPVLGVNTQMYLRYDHGASSVVEEPLNILEIKSILDSQEVGITHAITENIKRRIALGIAFVHRENKTSLLGEPFSFVPGEPTGIAKLNAWRFSQDYVERWESQVLALRSTITWGRTNVLEISDDSIAAPSQNYVFWLGQIQFARRLSPKSELLLRASIQWARDRLLSLERISVGGVSSVRGYRENQLVRDQGYTVSLELPYVLHSGAYSMPKITLVPFLDYGEAQNLRQGRDELASAGLGLRLQLGGCFAEAYAAKQLVNPEPKTSGNLQDRGVHFQVRYDF